MDENEVKPLLLEYDNPYWRDNPEMFGQLYWIVKNNYRNHVQTIIRKPKIKPRCKRVSYPDTWDLYCWINDVLPKLRDPIYNMKTKIYWILNGIQDFPFCANETHGKHTLEGKNVITSTLGYKHHSEQHEIYCCNKCKYEDEKFAKYIIEQLQKNFSDFDWAMRWHEKQNSTRIEKYGKWLDYSRIEKTVMEKYGVKCVFQNPVIRQKCMDWLHKKYGEQYINISQVPAIKDKSKETLLARTGFSNSMQNPAVKEKVKQTCIDKYGTRSVSYKYVYNGISFDSGWEICFYEYMIDHNKSVKYPSGACLEYRDVKGNLKYYYPDFLIDGELIEIKGKQFFDKDGTMCCPFRQSTMSDDEYENLCKTYELKHQCMIEHNVKIITNKEIQPILDYIQKKHNVNTYMEYCIRFSRVNS